MVMNNEEILARVIKLRNLAQYKQKTEEELIKIALAQEQAKVQKILPFQESLDRINIEELFSDKEEKKYAKDLLIRYLQDFSLETISDVNLLKQLIYLEVFQKLRLQKTADVFQKENQAVPIAILDAIHRNLDKIIELKNALRLTRLTVEQDDAYKALQLLIKKSKIWREENQASRTRVCPHCGKMVLWIMRPEVWEIYKHPFFKDRTVGNEHLVHLYKERTLTKEDLSKIFEVSTDYIDWLCEKWGMGTVSQVPSKPALVA